MKTNHHFFSFINLFLILLTMFLVSGCAGKEVVDACLEGRTYGFWYGLLHGFIAPVSFIGMLIQDDVVMYAQNNNGAWYAAGFLLGSGGYGFLGGKTIGRRKRD